MILFIHESDIKCCRVFLREATSRAIIGRYFGNAKLGCVSKGKFMLMLFVFYIQGWASLGVNDVIHLCRIWRYDIITINGNNCLLPFIFAFLSGFVCYLRIKRLCIFARNQQSSWNKAHARENNYQCDLGRVWKHFSRGKIGWDMGKFGNCLWKINRITIW